MQRLKISREGIILIKSFEGFRPHAARRDDGRWVIGYGHTLSAREGGVVSEPDAELLLQFDLIPIAKALNEVDVPLNQHQFDALASFAFSVGLERFQSSDVLSRLTAGSTGATADAIVGWADPRPFDSPSRRRAAERALFVADPDRPVALSELLAAPLPPPVVLPVFNAEPDTVAEAATAEPGLTTAAEAPVEADSPATGPSAAHAGPIAESVAADTLSAPVAELAPEEPASAQAFGSQTSASTPDDATGMPTPDDQFPVEQPNAAAVHDAASPAPEATSEPVAPAAPPLQRYSAYGANTVGPLPGVMTPALRTPGEAPARSEADAALPRLILPEPATDETLPPPELTRSTFPELADPEPVQASNPVHNPEVDGREPPAPTASDEASAPPTQRLVWPHAETSAHQSPLFEEDGALRLGAHQMIRHEIVSEQPLRLDWREIGLYVIMSGFGLLTFGMAVAAFRRASLPSGGSEFTTIAWVLAVFGFACIAVSAWNLYRKLGRPED